MTGSVESKHSENGSLLLGRSLQDVNYMQLSVGFQDDSGFAVRLTDIQRAAVIVALGIHIDGENGGISMYSDKELIEFMSGKQL